jgi:group I intron endonuclease
MGYIYKITNKVDGKIYVGQTIQVLEDRWRQHKKIGSNCRYLKRAFNKYGIDNFEFNLICICFDEDLDKYEIQYMEKYSSMVPNGYNLRKGGNSGKHHEETKKKISESLKGRTDIFNHNLGKSVSEETKKKISNALKGRTDIIYAKNQLGIPHTEETKKKISESHKIKGKRVMQYDSNNSFIKIFLTVNEASKENNISESSIRLCCKYPDKILKGFKWKYETNDNTTIKYNYNGGFLGKKHSEETKKNISEIMKGTNHPNYGKKYSEEKLQKMSEAMKGINLSKKISVETLEKRRLNLINNPEIKEKISNSLKEYHKNKINAKNIIIKEKIIIKINQYDLNNILVNSFNSIIEAANITQISRYSISKVCNNKQKIAGGFIWKKE